MEKAERNRASECLIKSDNAMEHRSELSVAEATYFDIYSSCSHQLDATEMADGYDYKANQKTLDLEPNYCLVTGDMASDLNECLEKYFAANCLCQGQTFNCPTCRASVRIPHGGATMFPTNFHIVNLRKRSRELDMGQTIKDAIQYLEKRAEEIVDEMTERKRHVLIAISKRREELVSRIEDMVETLLESVEEHHSTDSTESVNTISAVKDKLSELQAQLKETCSDIEIKMAQQTEAIQLNALTKLRRQAEIISNVNNELEELKQEADRALTNILDTQLAFCEGECPADELKQIFGRLVLLNDGQTLDEIRSQERNEEGFSPLHVKSWSQSWWVLLFTVLPAVICTMFVKVILTFFEKLLG
ncbi:hypothetical protein LSH36_55g06041 [Paralvinella palmiformis]|uniref:Uncharacterized protein n=1 Tax=Paralvinella palmiformis TaxID=53620 RepID=A0AAD9K565_9ANNE|nr:hypothetical protein LSH36_55g06041 [Paralvinella palmiformis]